MREGEKLPSPFSDPAIVKKLHYDEDRLTLAKRQLEDQFSLKSIGRKIRDRRITLPREGEKRSLLDPVIELVEKQFGTEKSALKQKIILEVQSTLLTNRTETESLASKLYSTKDWEKEKKLVYLDSPQQINGQLDTAEQRLGLVEYLVGKRDDPPDDVLAKIRHELTKYKTVSSNSSQINEASRETLYRAKKSFLESDVVIRNYTLQAMFEGSDNLFSDKMYNKLLKLVMGKHFDNQILKEIMDAYLSILPTSERKHVIGHLLSKMASSKGNKLTLSTIFDSMGAFGAKMAQSLRSIGALTGEARKELERFFDNADPPDRPEIMDRLKKVFGKKNIENIEFTRELRGSGSVNYVVLADIKNPKTQKREKVIIRIQRDYVEGRARNESANWTKALEKLKQSKNEEILNLVKDLDEANKYAVRHLRRGGLELNQKRERDIFKTAKEIYAKKKNSRTGFSIDVGEPNFDLQELVSKKYQKKISVYKFVDGVSVLDIKDKALRKKLALQILESELEAIFEKGHFDPDGHPGNWLIDLKNKRLVRIDYAQMVENPISRFHRDTFKKMIAHLLYSQPSEDLQGKIVDEFKNIFKINKKINNLDSLLKNIINNESYKSLNSPIERLLHLKREVGSKLVKLGKLKSTLKFTKEAQEIFGAVTRLPIYKELIGGYQFNMAFIRTLGVDKKELIKGIAQDKIRFYKEKVLSTKNNIQRCLIRALRATSRNTY